MTGKRKAMEELRKPDRTGECCRAFFHLPGVFEFYDLYQVFLPLFRRHREYFYNWCEIGSIYGAPADCLWGGGRVGGGERAPEEVLALTQEYGISARLTLSNSLLRKEHLAMPDATGSAGSSARRKVLRAESLSIRICSWDISRSSIRAFTMFRLPQKC